MSEAKADYVAGTAIVPAQTYDANLSIEAAVDRHNLLVRYVETILREGIDYGKVPGVDKPFLYKAGAEKLASFFGLRAEMEETSRLEDWEKPLFAYSHMCTLRHLGQIVAQCEGSCNSMESKYRWRKIWEWKATDADKERAVRTEKRKTRDGRMATVYVVENDDIFSQINTLQKMSQKRALVGAVLIACNASEFFSHAFEEIIDEEQREPENGQPNGDSGAGAIRARLQDSAAKYAKDRQPSEGQRGLLVGKLAEALQDKDAKVRHLILSYLWGKESSKALTYGEVGAMLKWLIEGKDDDTGDYLLSPEGVQEAHVIWKAAQVNAGQEIMDLFGEEEAA